MAYEDEKIIGIIEPGASNQSLIFTTTRVLIVKSRSALVSGAAGAIVGVVSVILFGILIGIFLGIVIMAICNKVAGKPKDFSKVSIESILKMEHKEILYNQIEKVEMRKGSTKFFYMDFDGKKKKTQFATQNGKRHEYYVELAHKVLQDRVVVK